MDKKTNEELRREVLHEDATRDVNINIAVFVAGAAMLSSAAGALAVLSILFLSSFRKDVEKMWLSCIPLCFTFVTGVAVAYRKQMADVGVHIALVVVTLLAGGAGYGLSVEPVYFNRENCTAQEDYDGDCSREVLTTMYFVAGAVASGCAVLGFLGSLCACSNAMSRRARREKYRQMRLEYEENQRRGAVRDQKRKLGQPSLSSPATIPVPRPVSNGTPEKSAHPSKLNGHNGVNGTSKTPIHSPAQNSLLESSIKPLSFSLPPQIIEEEHHELIQEHMEAENDKPETEKEDQPEVTADQPEVIADQPEVTKEAPKIMTTTIIVRESQVEKKKPIGVDRATQVDPEENVEVPTRKDVGVSPYQDVDGAGDETKLESNGEVPGEKIQNADSEKASNVMTHL